MAATQPAFDYSSYDYAYDGSASSAYPAYAGYEAGASYPPPGAYDAYGASAAYPPNAAPGSSYATVDPYSGYPATAYAYPTSATATSAAAPPPAGAASQTSYSATYGASPSTAAYTYDSRRVTPPPPPASAAAHYAPYDYAASAAGAYAGAPPPPGSTYSPYKTGPTANGTAPPTAYPTYPSSAPPPHGAYGIPPGSHLSGAMGPPPPPQHAYGPPPSTAGMIPRRPEYYPSAPVHQSMHYIPQQPQSTHYRLPPRGGYQRELDEPGDENALLRHVIYITGLPKEIQNETLAGVFAPVCGEIAPVDVRSPKPKIWVYKDRQTREGKGEATITFINPDSCQTAISYFDGKELFGREIRVTLCPRRMYSMQKQNTPFNPAAPSNNSNSMIKQINTNNIINTTTTAAADSSSSTVTATSASTTPTSTSTPSSATTVTATTTATTTPKTTSTSVTAANPIATISSSTLGLPRQLNHSLFKLRQTPEQQRGLLPTPPIPYGAPMIGNAVGQRDGARKELPRIALNRGNYNNPAGIRPKPY